MKTYRREKARRDWPRPGFTLVELMVVMVVIGILAAFILPAIYAGIRRANEARVMTEISGLSTAIGAFKSKYGSEPPSSMTIYLTAAGWNANPTYRGIIRGIWPQFDFTMNAGGANPNITAYPATFTAAAALQGTPGVSFTMNSGECLLFFLGGVVNSAGQAPVGFAKNPLYPFAPSLGVGSVANRDGPFYEFTNLDQFTDIDSNGVNEWKDPLPGQTNPYLYFSSYEGKGYNTAELPTTNAGANYLFLSDVYRVSSAIVAPPSGPASSGTGSQTLAAQKSQSFQIISPGYDTSFGFGGVFNPSLSHSGLTPIVGTQQYPDADNLTNFNAGRLSP